MCWWPASAASAPGRSRRWRAAASGALTLIDLDHVAESNINRQIHALDAPSGQAKVEAMRERIAQINPGCQVLAIDDFVEPGNWPRC